MRGWLCMVLVVALAFPSAAAPLDPVGVALESLSPALRSAIRESQDHLLADQAQQQLDLTLAYVQGFSALPEGESGLRDPAVREAFAWTEQFVEALLIVPGRLAAAEQAYADCDAYFANVTLAQGQRTVTTGRTSLASIDGVLAAVHDLAARRPANVPAAPVEEALAVLEDWDLDRAPTVHSCVLSLAEELDLGLTSLVAELVPDHAYRTSRVQILGFTPEPATISAPSLGWSVEAGDGSFRVLQAVDRQADLGLHAVTVTAGTQHLTLNLTVDLAPLELRVEAPGSVADNASFHVVVTAVNPLGAGAADGLAVQLAWQGQDTGLVLDDGQGGAALQAPGPGRYELVATSDATQLLSGAERRLVITVPAVGAEAATQPDEPDADNPLDPNSWLGAGSWAWWLVAVGALAVAVAGIAVAASRSAKGQVAPSPRRSPPFRPPNSLVGAVAWGLGSLRQRGLVAPGTTVREWVAAQGGPELVVHAFEQTRYGERPEARSYWPRAVDWMETQWRRWFP